MDDIEFPSETNINFEDLEDINSIPTYDNEIFGSGLNLGDTIISKSQMLKNPKKRFWYLLQTFYKAGLMKSKDNNPMIRLYFHAIMGAYLKNYTVITGVGTTDMRTPIIWIQDSSTGKSQLNKFGVDVALKLALKATETTEFTTAGMIGTTDSGSTEYNRRYGLTYEGQSKEIKTKYGSNLVTYQPPIIFGDMKEFDIIFVDEGKILFQTGAHTENILSVLQPALDYPGIVRKKLAAKEPIEYESSCTLVISTIEFSGLNGELMLQGFFPRCLFWLRKIGFFQYAKMHEKICESVFDENKYKQLITDFSESLINHPTEPVSRERHKIMMGEENLEKVSSTVNQWFNIANQKLQGREARIIAAFISRMHTFIYKIAGQVAVLNSNYSTGGDGEKYFKIGIEEIEYAISVLMPLFNGLIKGIGINETSYDRQIMHASSKLMQKMIDSNNETLTKSQMILGIKKILGISQGKANNMYEELVRGNYFNEDMTSRGKTITVVPNWELYSGEQRNNRGGNKYEQY